MKKSCKEDKVAYTFFSSFFLSVKAEYCHIPTHPSLKPSSEYQINSKYYVSEFDKRAAIKSKICLESKTCQGKCYHAPFRKIHLSCD